MKYVSSLKDGVRNEVAPNNEPTVLLLKGIGEDSGVRRWLASIFDLWEC